MSRAVAHVDMDAFYAAVEQRDRPELRGRPVIVGADPRGRGVVSAASYEARPYGVRSAMPIGRAARLCPHAVFLPPDMARYARVSREIMAILAEFSPLVEPVSIDEAFVDLTGTGRLFGPPDEAVRTIRARIRAEIGLTASAGLATNKFVAKVASDLGKPDGLVVVPPGHEARFLAPLPVSRLWGVGPVLTRQLAGFGIERIGQLQTLPDAVLTRRLGPSGPGFRDLALGRDSRPVAPWTAPKSVGAETTFASDTRERARLARTLRQHAERVARELRGQGLTAATVTLKVRFSDFRTVTRSHTVGPVADGLALYRRALELLDRVPRDAAVRLVGLSASGLGPRAAGQLDLLDPGLGRRERLAALVDELADRFGDRAVIPASLLAPGTADRE